MNEILLEAAHQIETKGLFKSYLINQSRPECTCTVLAIDEAVSALDQPYTFDKVNRLVMRVADYLGLSYDPEAANNHSGYGNVGDVVIAWNDAPERTKSEVVRVLREVAYAEQEHPA